MLYRPKNDKNAPKYKKVGKVLLFRQIYVKITLLYGPKSDKNGPKYKKITKLY